MKKYAIILLVLISLQAATITAATPRPHITRGIDWAYIGGIMPPYAQEIETVSMTDWNY